MLARLVVCQPTPVDPAFEVASIKLSVPGISLRGVTKGRTYLTTRSLDLRSYVRIAYNLQDYQVSVPDSLNDEKYDIDATAAAPVSSEELDKMLQTLLNDKFRLVFHKEIKIRSTYRLIVSPHGPKFKQSTEVNQNIMGSAGYLAFRGVPISDLIVRLSDQLDRPVLDLTGLDEYYDFDLDWRQSTSDSSDSLIAAVEEQLGLKLEVTQTPFEVWVIDHAEKIANR
jgi:uncharacterized protein (TIGR03435 family)